MNDPASHLPNDILILIFYSIQNDYNSLSRCALVDHAFNHAASKYLYRRVVVAPLLSLKEIPTIPSNCNLISAARPQYAHFVETIQITGYLPSNSTFTQTILNAINAFENIRVAILTPVAFHATIFSGVLKHLTLPNPLFEPVAETPIPPRHEAPNLRELAVNTSCTDEDNAPILAQITGLSKLSIHSPTRAILELLPDWLRRLSDSLAELHLKDNCGSVTPGVLKSIVPLVQRNLRAVSLGLSYSLTDEDVFAFLRKLMDLEKVELRYYWQLRPPISRPDLMYLQSFTACHANFQTRREVQSLCKWIRRAIFSSPIRTLHIIQDDRRGEEDTPSNTGANVSFRSVIDHICARHSGTLRVLHMGDAYLDVKSLKKLFSTCGDLEDVSICAGSHALTIFRKYSLSLSRLHTASFNIKNIRLSRRRIFDMELITTIMKHGPPCLRTLTINGQIWESGWKHTKDGTFILSIHKVPQLIFPWDREPRSLLHQSVTEVHPPMENVLKLVPPIISPSILVDGVKAAPAVGSSGISNKGNRLHVRFIESN